MNCIVFYDIIFHHKVQFLCFYVHRHVSVLLLVKGQGRPIAVRNLLFPKMSGAHLDSKISAIVLKFTADSLSYPKQGGSAGNLIIEMLGVTCL